MVDTVISTPSKLTIEVSSRYARYGMFNRRKKKKKTATSSSPNPQQATQNHPFVRSIIRGQSKNPLPTVNLLFSARPKQFD